MAKSKLQSYPRIEGLLDESQLVSHRNKLSRQDLKKLIKKAIQAAQKRSSREILTTATRTKEEEKSVNAMEGKKLFKYFHQYVSDPAATAHQLQGKHYREICKNQFRNRSVQKERMNSGWRYQYLAVFAAESSKRFDGVSDIGTAEGDFTAKVRFQNESAHARPLRLYVSVKNRSNTMGGQDWPKAIYALENLAINDRNADGPYCCVFGIAIERGQRTIRRSKKGLVYSSNTEMWLADFFWPFFSNYSYEEVMLVFLEVLLELDASQSSQELDLPEELIDSFGTSCKDAGLLDTNGRFSDPYKLVRYFVSPLARKSKQSMKRGSK